MLRKFKLPVWHIEDEGASETGAPIVEEPVVDPVVEPVPEAEEDVAKADDAPKEDVEEAPVEAVPEAPVFDHTAEDFDTQIDTALSEWELPPSVTAVVTALKAKLAEPQEAFAPYADYGEAADIRTLLDRQKTLDSVEEVTPGAFRPKTKEFLETISDPVTKEWLHHDLSSEQSSKYPGLNRFEEKIADIFGKEGEPVSAILDRYSKTVAHLQSGTIPTLDAPSFIPENLREAYWTLPQQTREELAEYAPDAANFTTDGYGNAFDPLAQIRNDRLRELSLIQKGLDADRQDAVRTAEARKADERDFAQAVGATQEAVYNGLRTTFADNLTKEVKFSDDPKMQQLLAAQTVSLMAQALEPGTPGDFARKSLESAGVQFDYQKAQQLIKNVEIAAVALTTQQRMKGADGQPMNKVETNQAKNALERVTREWQAFGKDIIDQQARLVSTGTAQSIEKAVEKKKIAAKARPVSQGTPSAATKKTKLPNPLTPEGREWYANKILQEEARKKSAYA